MAVSPETKKNKTNTSRNTIQQVLVSNDACFQKLKPCSNKPGQHKRRVVRKIFPAHDFTATARPQSLRGCTVGYPPVAGGRASITTWPTKSLPSCTLPLSSMVTGHDTRLWQICFSLMRGNSLLVPLFFPMNLPSTSKQVNADNQPVMYLGAQPPPVRDTTCSKSNQNRSNCRQESKRQVQKAGRNKLRSVGRPFGMCPCSSIVESHAGSRWLRDENWSRMSWFETCSNSSPLGW